MSGWARDFNDLVLWGGVLLAGGAHWSAVVALVATIVVRGAYWQEETSGD